MDTLESRLTKVFNRVADLQRWFGKPPEGRSRVGAFPQILVIERELGTLGKIGHGHPLEGVLGDIRELLASPDYKALRNEAAEWQRNRKAATKAAKAKVAAPKPSTTTPIHQTRSKTTTVTAKKNTAKKRNTSVRQSDQKRTVQSPLSKRVSKMTKDLLAGLDRMPPTPIEAIRNIRQRPEHIDIYDVSHRLPGSYGAKL